jgi:hypothetical protein
MPDTIPNSLKHLYERLPASKYGTPPTALSVALGTGVYELWAAYSHALRDELLPQLVEDNLRTSYGRLDAHVLKVATLLAAMDWLETSEVPQVEVPHLMRAIEIVETWRYSAHRAVTQVAETYYSTLRSRILNIISTSKEGATFRVINRKLSNSVKPDEVRNMLRQMTEVGDIRSNGRQTTPRGGQPTERYVVVTD